MLKLHFKDVSLGHPVYVTSLETVPQLLGANLMDRLLPLMGWKTNQVWSHNGHHYFHDFEPAVSVNEQLPSSLQSCNTVVEMNFTCPSDTFANTAAVSTRKTLMRRVYSASDDTPSTLWRTVNPYNDTNGVSPATDPMTPTGETLCDITDRDTHLSLQVLKRLPHADAVVTDRPRQPPGDLVERLQPLS